MPSTLGIELLSLLVGEKSSKITSANDTLVDLWKIDMVKDRDDLGIPQRIHVLQCTECLILPKSVQDDHHVKFHNLKKKNPLLSYDISDSLSYFDIVTGLVKSCLMLCMNFVLL
ncbi:hypothetical protein ACH5RR_000825 [Cinchona calisaya]|uniref:C2H2-type domain-containing protein n=1 Tax=Cinchona calisaya TaxID=153742 RepID=A0ABD3B1V5_9GENT